MRCEFGLMQSGQCKGKRGRVKMARLDVVIVSQGKVKSRSKALQLIKGGQVYVSGKQITKAGYEICESEMDSIEIKGEINPFVSKGGLKLEKAITCFGVDFGGKVVVDIGSSTGGFTDCALQFGASKVYAVDVGKSQLDDRLRADSRVVVYEETDFRQIESSAIADATLAVADVSFISLTKLLPKLQSLIGLQTLVFLIKPQFECGADVAKKHKGIVLNKAVHSSVLNNVIAEFYNAGFVCVNLTHSPITGGDGNIEYVAMFVNIGSNQTKNNCNSSINNYLPAFNNVKNSIKDIISNAFIQLSH